MLLWLAGMAAITYWCVTQHLPALEAKIQTNAQTALDSTGAQNIGLNVEGRVATLTGSVESESQKSQFIESVSNADGIRSVTDLLSLNNQTAESSVASQEPATTPIPTNTASNAANSVIQDSIVQEQAASTPDQQQTTAQDQESNENLAIQSTETPTDEATTAVATGETEQSPSIETDETQTELSTTEIAQSVDEKALALVQRAVQQARANQAKSDQAQSGNTEPTDTDALAEQTSEQSTAADGAEASVPVITGLPPTFNLRTDDGTLSLNGDMSNRDNMIEFVQIAMESLNASYVINSVQAHENRQSANWLPAIIRFLPSMQNLDNAEIDIIETQVTLSGVAQNAEEHDKVINDALGMLSELSVVERISIKEAEPTISTDANATPANDQSSGTNSSSQTLDEQRETLRQETDLLLRDRILFQSGSDVLTADSAESVEKIAELFSRYPDIEIEINGHTDSSGNTANNLRLSQLRANAVRDYLVGQGIDVSRLSAYGFGDGVPIADNDTPAGRKLNRRIEFNF